MPVISMICFISSCFLQYKIGIMGWSQTLTTPNFPLPSPANCTIMQSFLLKGSPYFLSPDKGSPYFLSPVWSWIRLLIAMCIKCGGGESTGPLVCELCCITCHNTNQCVVFPLINNLCFLIFCLPFTGCW